MSNFKSLSNFFQNDCTLFYAPQKYTRVPVASHLCSDLILSVLYNGYIVVPPCSFTDKIFSLYDWYFFCVQRMLSLLQICKDFLLCSPVFYRFNLYCRFMIQFNFDYGTNYIQFAYGYWISNFKFTHTQGSRNLIWLFLSVLIM